SSTTRSSPRSATMRRSSPRVSTRTATSCSPAPCATMMCAEAARAICARRWRMRAPTTSSSPCPRTGCSHPNRSPSWPRPCPGRSRTRPWRPRSAATGPSPRPRRSALCSGTSWPPEGPGQTAGPRSPFAAGAGSCQPESAESACTGCRRGPRLGLLRCGLRLLLGGLAQLLLVDGVVLLGPGPTVVVGGLGLSLRLDAGRDRGPTVLVAVSEGIDEVEGVGRELRAQTAQRLIELTRPRHRQATVHQVPGHVLLDQAQTVGVAQAPEDLRLVGIGLLPHLLVQGLPLLQVHIGTRHLDELVLVGVEQIRG